MTNAFQKAIKTESKLLMAISGPSGAGKTYTALAFATELAGANGRIAVIDTEHGSASKYADLYSFDTMSMQPPYHPTRFAKGVQAAHDAGYDVLVIDSLTHAWAGTGGALELVDEASKRFKGNSYMAWGDVTPIYRGMIDTIVSADLHVIVTMRSKTEYVLETNERGKTVPKKVGMAPISRDGVEYEFDVWMEMDIDNNGIVQKTRCPELTARVFAKPGAEVVDILKSWLGGEKPLPRDPKPANESDSVSNPIIKAAREAMAAEPEPAPAHQPNGNGKKDNSTKRVTIPMLKELHIKGKAAHGDDKWESVCTDINAGLGVDSSKAWPWETYWEVMNGLDAQPEQPAPEDDTLGVE
jgi:DNA polymerase III delta prime subunit